MQIPFGEWLPDQPEYLNPGATNSKQCLLRTKFL